MSRQVYQLKITLMDADPSVWRRVLVPAAYTLDRLHRVVQYAMGWQDCHLHSFEIDGVQYGDPDPDGELALHDELDARLDAVAGKGTRMLYTYDFGDWWEHEILVEDVVFGDPDARYPCCVGGAGACPPEDVGGAFGYREFRAAVTDPSHADHQAMRQWVGPHFDPEAFDPGRASTLLRRLA